MIPKWYAATFRSKIHKSIENNFKEQKLKLAELNYEINLINITSNANSGNLMAHNLLLLFNNDHIQLTFNSSGHRSSILVEVLGHSTKYNCFICKVKGNLIQL